MGLACANACQVGGAPRGGDDHLQATAFGAGAVFDDLLRGSMGRSHVCLEGDSQFFQRAGRVLHGFPVGLRAHQNSDYRCIGHSNLQAGGPRRLLQLTRCCVPIELATGLSHPCSMEEILAPETVDFSRHTVLIVDDDRMMRRYLEAQLANLGCRFLSAGNAEEARALIAKATPDLILLDIVMPGMDGLEFCRQLKDDPATRDIAVIHLTSLGRDAKDRSFAAGAEDFLNKPPHFVELRSRMRSHLLIRALQEEIKTAGTEAPITWEPGQPARVLVVESHPKLREHMVEWLLEGGFQAQGVEGLQAATPLLATGQVDLLVLDHHPVDGDGYAFSLQLRTLRRMAELPILLVCARQNLEREIQVAADQGPSDYLTKPFQAGELRLRVSVLLRQAALIRGGALSRTAKGAITEPQTGLFTSAFLQAHLALLIEQGGAGKPAVLGFKVDLPVDSWHERHQAFDAAVGVFRSQRAAGEVLARAGDATFLLLIPSGGGEAANLRAEAICSAGLKATLAVVEAAPGEAAFSILKRLAETLGGQ